MSNAGRPKTYSNAADKQRAYRERQKALRNSLAVEIEPTPALRNSDDNIHAECDRLEVERRRIQSRYLQIDFCSDAAIAAWESELKANSDAWEAAYKVYSVNYWERNHAKAT